jgi:hypothetical protein
VPLVALTRKSSELFSLEVFAGAERGVELLLLAAEILYIVVLSSLEALGFLKCIFSILSCGVEYCLEL